MSAALMQLVAFGVQDVILVGNPEVTFFKTVYMRHTPFSIETMKQTFDGFVDFGREVHCKIKKNGDFIGHSYIQATLPGLNTPDSQVMYCNRVGYKLLKSVSLKIGGQTIDKHSSTWLYCWSELSMSNEKKSILDDIVGIDNYITPNTITNINNEIDDYNMNTDITLSIPLQFSFCKNINQAIPIVALQYHEIEIVVELEDFVNCLQHNTNNVRGIVEPIKPLKSLALYVDYYYIDTNERKQVVMNPHEYLIETTQELEVPVSVGIQSIPLEFRHPLKELIWVIRRNSSNATLTVNNFIHTSGTPATEYEVEYEAVNTSETLNTSFNNFFINDQTFKIPINENEYRDITLERNFIRNNVTLDNIGLNDTNTDGEVNQFNAFNFTDFTTNSGSVYVVSETEADIKHNDIVLKRINTVNVTIEGEEQEVAANEANQVISNGENYHFIDTAVDTKNTFSSGLIFEGDINTCVSATIKLNGTVRYETRDSLYHNSVQPYQHHSGNPRIGINSYSFAFFPEEIQPSGVCNFSRVDKKVLEVNSAVEGIITIMGFGYNVLRISKGLGGLAYNN